LIIVIHKYIFGNELYFETAKNLMTKISAWGQYFDKHSFWRSFSNLYPT